MNIQVPLIDLLVSGQDAQSESAKIFNSTFDEDEKKVLVTRRASHIEALYELLASEELVDEQETDLAD